MERLKEAKESPEETESVEEEITSTDRMPEMQIDDAPMAQVAYAPELSLPSIRRSKNYLQKR